MPVMAETTEIEPVLKQAATELEKLQTVVELREWWKRYYLLLGHRRLGRMLIGRPVESLLGSRDKERD